MNDPNGGGIPIPVGVVGAGNIAQVIHLPVLTRHPDVKVQALCDADASKAAVVANKFGIPHIYDDIAEMLRAEELEAVFILTPNNLHLPMSLIALDYGVHVFLEKPAARNSDEAERIRRKAASAGRMVFVGMHNRFRTDANALRTFLKDRELGDLFFLKAGWLQARHQAIKQPWLFQKNVSGGGVVLDLGVQMIDLAWWLLDKPDPLATKAFSFKVEKSLAVEDFCVACVTFDNQISLSLEVSWDFPVTKDQLFLEVAGENGTGMLNPLRLQKFWHGQIVNITPDVKDSRIAHFKKGYENEVNHFFDYLTGRVSQLESPIDDAVKVLSITDAIYQSFHDGREITFDKE